MKVLNFRSEAAQRGLREGSAVYVGRPKGGGVCHYGNPFTHMGEGTLALFKVNTREEAVRAYDEWLRGFKIYPNNPRLEAQRAWILNHLRELRGKDLVCWCAPRACHADILLVVANKEEL